MPKRSKRKTAAPTEVEAPPAPEETRGPGRPSKYLPEYARIAFFLCERGATDAEIAEALDVSESTVNLWKLEHPEFSESINAGKEKPDDEVERALFERAIGYSHPSEKVFQHEGGVVRAAITQHYPPDPTSMIFWLKNRRKDRWRDKHDITVKADESLENILEAINPTTPATGAPS